MIKFTDRINKIFKGKKVKYNENLNIKINLPYNLPSAENTKMTSSNSALARPFRVFAEGGRPIGKVNHLFYRDKKTGNLFVLGSLCFTSYSKNYKRIIFYPGLLGRKFVWHSSVGNFKSEGELDHFTVEPDLKSWHYTILIKNKKEDRRLPNNDIYQIKPKLYYWFGLSVSSIEKFEKLYKENTFHFKILPSQLDKCYDYLLNAKNNSLDHIVEQPDEEATNNDFIHFDFLIDKRFLRRHRKMPKNIVELPIKKPIRIDVPEQTNNYLIRQHRVKIANLKGDIIVSVSKHKGMLANQGVFISGKSK